MRTFRAASLAAAAVLLASTPALAATATSQLTVTATVENACTITGGTLNFGFYNPIDGSDATAQTAVSVTCTLGTSATIGLNDGVNPDGNAALGAPIRRLSDGAAVPSFLSYALYQDAGHATAWGNDSSSDWEFTGTGLPQTVDIYGRIPANQNVPSGTYTDSVTITVNF